MEVTLNAQNVVIDGNKVNDLDKNEQISQRVGFNMRKIIVLICFLFCAVNSFAVEKSRTFGNYTVYFDTEDVGKYYENPQKAALERDLVIYQEVPAYMIEIIKSGLTDSALSKKSEDEQNAFQCLKVIITNNLAGGRIYYKKEKLQISVFKDSEGNLYYAD